MIHIHGTNLCPKIFATLNQSKQKVTNKNNYIRKYVFNMLHTLLGQSCHLDCKHTPAMDRDQSFGIGRLFELPSRLLGVDILEHQQLSVGLAAFQLLPWRNLEFKGTHHIKVSISLANSEQIVT